MLALGVLQFTAQPIASLFSNDADVTREIVRYLWIIPFGYATVGILSVTEETLNAIGKPVMASVQTLAHMFVFTIPFSVVGAHLHAITGLLSGLAAADILGGVVGVILTRWMCLKGERMCRLRDAETAAAAAEN